ncbi:MAG: orotate phosphoribosyltransferase [Thermodesulfovibrionales bacterium]|nr:orotate phosphoribosyltransferase [Thermodesulfovibrionales bacterium]
MDDSLKMLRDIIADVSFSYSKEPVFKLTSGKMSNFYFNLKKTTMRPDGLYLVGKVVFEKISSLGLDIKAIGGLTLGADPIAYATSMYSYLQGKGIYAFVVRKEPKQHGMGLPIEGNIEKGDKVVVIDDVVTTGGSTIKAIKAAEGFGLNIQAVLVIVDRCEYNGIENIRDCGYPVYGIYTISDFMPA